MMKKAPHAMGLMVEAVGASRHQRAEQGCTHEEGCWIGSRLQSVAYLTQTRVVGHQFLDLKSLLFKHLLKGGQRFCSVLIHE